MRSEARASGDTDRLRAGSISLPDTIAQSVTVMAPAMSGAFITYLAAVKAGGATPLAFVLALFSCLLIGGVVGEFALHLPSAGSLYTYVSNGLGPLWGVVVGWTYTVGFVVVGPAVLAGFSVFTSMVMRHHAAPTPMQQWWVWFAVGVAAYFVLSYYGIQFSTRTELIFTVATAATLLLLAAIIIFDGGAAGNTIDAFRPAAAGVTWPLVMGGLAFGILSFTGFETAAVLAEETRDPRRNIPLAVIGAVVFGGVFYIVVTYATAVGYGIREATVAWPKSAGGLSALSQRYAAWLGDWVLLAGGFSALFCGLGVHNAVARTAYAMGREGVLPRVLGRTHRRHGTPHVAIAVNLVLVVVGAAAIIGATGAGTRDAVGATPGPLSAGFYLFTEGLTIGTPLIMFCYTVLSVAGISFGWRRAATQPNNVRHGAVSLGALVASAVALFGSLYYSFVAATPGVGIPGPYRAVPLLDAVAVAVGAAGALAVRWRDPRAWAGIGRLFD